MNPNIPASFPKLNLQQWIKENKQFLQPPVSNKQLFSESRDSIVFVSGGPNTRNDFHVNPTEEVFLQLKGDIAVRVRPLDGSAPEDIIVREGELFLLPRWVPHRPQRPAGTIGLVIEFPRPDVMGAPGQDGLQWYCPECDKLVWEARWRLKKIDEDLKVIMHDFWGGPISRRTCKHCGYIIQRAGAIQLKGGKVKAATSASSKAKGAPSKPAAKSLPKSAAKPAPGKAAKSKAVAPKRK